MTKLEGKTLYGFGDSLVRGHWLDVGMLDDVAEKHGMRYTKYAQNGATVIPGIAWKLKKEDWPDIAAQIEGAPKEQPDFICFDGMTNDISPLVRQHYFGRIAPGFAGGYDTSTFTGAFEQICLRLREKYPESRVIYICPHKMKARDPLCQEIFQARAKEVCEKWSIPYADVYGASGLDTCDEEIRRQFSYDRPGECTGGSGTHLNAEGYARWYAPLIEKKLLECI